MVNIFNFLNKDIKDLNYFIKFEKTEIEDLKNNLESLDIKWFKGSKRIKEVEALKYYIKLREDLLLKLVKENEQRKT